MSSASLPLTSPPPCVTLTGASKCFVAMIWFALRRNSLEWRRVSVPVHTNCWRPTGLRTAERLWRHSRANQQVLWRSANVYSHETLKINKQIIKNWILASKKAPPDLGHEEKWWVIQHDTARWFVIVQTLVPCRSEVCCRRFGRTCCLYLQG